MPPLSVRRASSCAVTPQTTHHTQHAQEFTLAKDTDAQIFKLVGPVLVKQEREEAVGNVAKRIEFIRGDIGRLETRIKELEGTQERKKMEVVQLQQLLQSAAAAAEGGEDAEAAGAGAAAIPV